MSNRSPDGRVWTDGRDPLSSRTRPGRAMDEVAGRRQNEMDVDYDRGATPMDVDSEQGATPMDED